MGMIERVRDPGELKNLKHLPEDACEDDLGSFTTGSRRCKVCILRLSWWIHRFFLLASTSSEIRDGSDVAAKSPPSENSLIIRSGASPFTDQIALRRKQTYRGLSNGCSRCLINGPHYRKLNVPL